MIVIIKITKIIMKKEMMNNTKENDQNKTKSYLTNN